MADWAKIYGTGAKERELFLSMDLTEQLEQWSKDAVEEVGRLPANEVLNEDVQELVDRVAGSAELGPIDVDEQGIYTTGVEETLVDGGNPSRAGLLGFGLGPLKGAQVEVRVPFVGHPALFNMRPAGHVLGDFPRGRIDDEHKEIVLTFAAPALKEEEVRTRIAQQLALIRKFVDMVNAGLRDFRLRLRAEVAAAINERRGRLQHHQNLEEALGLPVRRRDDAPRAVPVARTNLGLAGLREHGEATAKGEPFLEARAYEEVVDIVIHMAWAFERSPTTFAKLQEEELRDFLLVILNGTFEGQAGGELFNGAGKTDILVRVEDRNVFIGECKIWSGEAHFLEGVDQLLSYLVWRDTKAALVLFIRQKDATVIIDKAEGVIRAHPNFKATGTPTGDRASRRNYLMASSDDANREIQLALVPVVLRGSPV